MLAAATTLWVCFGLWLAAPHVGLTGGVARTAAGLMTVELVALLAHGYGCEAAGACSTLGAVAGSLARVDVPILAVVFVAVVAGAGRRRRALS